MAKEFAIGDVVMLKSGGPQMTIRTIQTSGYVEVDYFPEQTSCRAEKDTFKLEELKCVRPFAEERP